MRIASLVLAASGACAAKPPPAIENRAAPPTAETFVLDAPLFTTDDTAPVVWTLHRDGAHADLVLGDRHYTGTATGGEAFRGELGAVTMDCHRGEVRAHVPGAEPAARAPHTPCGVPRTWHPMDTVTTRALTCTVHRDQLTTEVTMAASPGLQAVVDDCCDDQDRCERRWEIRQRYATTDLLHCQNCPCFDELVRRAAACKLPDDVRNSLDLAAGAAYPNKFEGDHDDPQQRCRDVAAFIVDNTAGPCGWSATP